MATWTTKGSSSVVACILCASTSVCRYVLNKICLSACLPVCLSLHLCFCVSARLIQMFLPGRALRTRFWLLHTTFFYPDAPSAPDFDCFKSISGCPDAPSVHFVIDKSFSLLLLMLMLKTPIFIFINACDFHAVLAELARRSDARGRRQARSIAKRMTEHCRRTARLNLSERQAHMKVAIGSRQNEQFGSIGCGRIL